MPVPFTVIFWVIFGVLMYLMYRQGVGITKSIAAIVFVFQPGNDCDRASVDSCTGWVRHRGRFRESRTYQFSFLGQLSKGDVEVFLMDEKKQPLLKLNRASPSGSITLDGKGRYYLRWEFRSASGKCELHW